MSKSLKDIYLMQRDNQQLMIANGMYDGVECINHTDVVPIDNIRLCSYHIQHLMSEIGEVLEADKRWKNFRNKKYDKANKAEEIADCFIVLMNIAMYSGINEEMLENMLVEKINKNRERIASEV